MGVRKKPEKFKLNDGIARIWEKFKRSYKIFLTATGKADDVKEVQAVVSLNLIRDDASDQLDSLNVTDAEFEDAAEIELKMKHLNIVQLN